MEENVLNLCTLWAECWGKCLANPIQQDQRRISVSCTGSVSFGISAVFGRRLWDKIFALFEEKLKCVYICEWICVCVLVLRDTCFITYIINIFIYIIIIALFVIFIINTIILSSTPAIIFYRFFVSFCYRIVIIISNIVYIIIIIIEIMINIVIIILIIINIFVLIISNIIVITPPNLQLISVILLACTMLFIIYTLYVAILELLSFLFRESPLIIVIGWVFHFTVDV